ncbi:MAG: DNA recombination protein RmuC, partial [Fimbriimonadaceae bacterium]|nr:DNA recombination protein RmuC [Alphaproteobacteria bacterium]
MSDVIFHLGGWPVTIGEFLVALGVLLAFSLMAIAILMWRTSRMRIEANLAEQQQKTVFEQRFSELLQAHNEMNGRLKSVAEISISRQSELTRSMNERLDQVSHRIGQNLESQSRQTGENLNKLNERLAVIDRAQKNIVDLSGQMIGLQDILANKQTRGAFGQGRMEAIIADGLPKNAYSFQATLSNRKRPDCLIHLPNDAAAIVIDAKFPLESFEAFKNAATPLEAKDAARQLQLDVGRHIKDIAERYLIPGETQDTAMMFVPSESIYADLYESFDDLIQKAYRSRIVIVSPSMLMLSIQVFQTILKDAKMREQAHLIQNEVVKVLADVDRLRNRVLDLQKHFGLAQSDIDKILI